MCRVEGVAGYYWRNEREKNRFISNSPWANYAHGMLYVLRTAHTKRICSIKYNNNGVLVHFQRTVQVFLDSSRLVLLLKTFAECSTAPCKITHRWWFEWTYKWYSESPSTNEDIFFGMNIRLKFSSSIQESGEWSSSNIIVHVMYYMREK